MNETTQLVYYRPGDNARIVLGSAWLDDEGFLEIELNEEGKKLLAEKPTEISLVPIGTMPVAETNE